MIFSAEWIDVAENLASGQQPRVLVPRPKASESDSGVGWGQRGHVGEFWVPSSPLNCDEVAWSVTATGEFVSVPVNAYRTTVRARAMILACGIEYGMRAMVTLLKKTARPIKHVHLILGNEVHETAIVIEDSPDNAGYRMYLGMCVQVGE